MKHTVSWVMISAQEKSRERERKGMEGALHFSVPQGKTTKFIPPRSFVAKWVLEGRVCFSSEYLSGISI